MKNRKSLAAIALVSVAAAALGTAVLAQGPMDAPGGMGTMMLNQFDAVDADKDGKVTQAELDAFRTARFTEADADKDGFLNQDELAAMQLKMMQARMADRAARMLTRLDADKDGKLAATEMPAVQVEARMFDLADADNDGAVSKDEMQQAQAWMQGHRDGKRDRGHGKNRGGDGWGWWN
ncbi:EF-hand domain-containing protein [Rhodobacter sp. Har01]|uniref:EF-hand domain-containing protein n=1 Tax=Rhodobacter sp. Har01 TaxID=2883999 RepID=UPI001D075E4B|nr:EF-hand domain-containing protein [Rhodobacter sp. Har01]MCB6178355.1 EF-hand domain-containing protein [Rhodobacter sp. Har01]